MKAEENEERTDRGEVGEKNLNVNKEEDVTKGKGK